jgi:hypothetical protein
MSHSIKSTEDIESLPSRTRFDKQSLKAPQKSQVGTQDKMSRIDKENGPLSGFCFL